MHLGHARTHLVTYLRARSSGGRIVMRMEDLDEPRVRPGSADDFLRAHEWLGLEFDEGPYFQSERRELYEATLERLERDGHVYACACSRREVETVDPGPAGDGGLRYPNTCRERAVDRDQRHALRFRMPEPSPAFHDAVFGSVPGGEVRGDFVLRRADRYFAYHLAVVVDDLDMQVTEIVRGADLLLATSRQIALREALGAPHPSYVHVPLVLGPDGKRLAKSHGSIGVLEYREQGIAAESLLGRLAFSLGIVPEPSAIAADELVERFDASAIGAAETGAVDTFVGVGATRS
jgi:glutamyl-tRNA synthetase